MRITAHKFVCQAKTYLDARSGIRYMKGQEVVVQPGDPRIMHFRSRGKVWLEQTVSMDIPDNLLTDEAKARGRLEASNAKVTETTGKTDTRGGEDATATNRTEDLDLDEKVINALTGAGIMNIDQIRGMGEQGLLQVPGIGSSRARDIMKAVADYDKALSSDDESGQ